MAAPDRGELKKKLLRLFVAYPLPKGLWNDVESVRLNNANVANIRWTPLQNLHITIFFLGEIQASAFAEVAGKIRFDVADCPSFKLEFEKISLEGRKRHSGMIWIKFLRNEIYSSLSLRLKNSLEEFLLHPVIVHDPIPHITIARLRRERSAERGKGTVEIENINYEFNPGFQLPEINFCELWQSLNTVEGVRYESLERFALKKEMS